MRSNPPARPLALRALSVASVALALVAPAAAQTTFSIDYNGPTIGIPSPTAITEGDILMPALGLPALGPLPPPVIAIPGGALGLPTWAACVGHPPGVPCGIEINALSYGLDTPFVAGMPSGSIKFSVGRTLIGLGGPMPPAVFTEAPIGEAAADVFADLNPLGWGCAFVPPFVLPPSNRAIVDGDGLPLPSPFVYPGLGLIEPAAVGCVLPDPGDNVDAIDVDGPFGLPVYFSLDGAVPEFFCGYPPGISSLANGPFSSADVLVSFGAVPAVWLPAAAMGLDFFGPNTDDLDALALFENGSGVPEIGACGTWGGASDMILFSVRAGSAVVGMIDPVTGLPIEPGDILTPPLVAGTFPTIFIAAETLGLATVRSAGFPDELDALDVTKPFYDCNGNGQEDAADIAFGLSLDCNANLIPDECESPVSYCTAGTSASGCQALLSATGTASATAPSGFVVSAATVEGNKQGLFFFGQNGRQASPWGNGTSYQCVRPPVKRGGLLPGAGTPGACDGAFSQDLNARWCPACPHPLQAPVPGVPLQIQLWYRDPANTSNQTTSLSDALEVIPCP